VSSKPGAGHTQPLKGLKWEMRKLLSRIFLINSFYGRMTPSSFGYPIFEEVKELREVELFNGYSMNFRRELVEREAATSGSRDTVFGKTWIFLIAFPAARGLSWRRTQDSITTIPRLTGHMFETSSGWHSLTTCTCSRSTGRKRCGTNSCLVIRYSGSCSWNFWAPFLTGIEEG
jgi:hypothetical protein